jgi:hypothetical protein
LAYLAAYQVKHKPEALVINRLRDAEQACWAGAGGEYNILMDDMVASHEFVQRFGD